MEDWQRDHITKNLSQLVSLTDFNDTVKVALLSKDILTDAEVDLLVSFFPNDKIQLAANFTIKFITCRKNIKTHYPSC